MVTESPSITSTRAPRMSEIGRGGRLEPSEKRRLVDIRGLLVPREQRALADRNRVPARIAVEHIGVLLLELLGLERARHGVRDLLLRRPHVAQIDRLAVSPLAERLLVEIDVHRAGERVRHHQRRRGQIVRACVRIDSSFEIAIAGQHRGGHEIRVRHALRDRLRQRSAVADAIVHGDGAGDERVHALDRQIEHWPPACGPAIHDLKSHGRDSQRILLDAVALAVVALATRTQSCEPVTNSHLTEQLNRRREFAGITMQRLESAIDHSPRYVMLPRSAYCCIALCARRKSTSAIHLRDIDRSGVRSLAGTCRAGDRPAAQRGVRLSPGNHYQQPGYYTFASVPVGTYELTVTMAGFETSKESGIALGGGEKRNVNVGLKIGSATETVMVSGTADLLTTVDSGEKSSTLSVKQLENFVQVGSNAAEFIKMMPGFGVQNGSHQRRELQRGHDRHQRQRQRRKPEPAEQCVCLQRASQRHPGHHGGRGARFRPRLQLRHAGQPQRGYDRRVQAHDVQLQRRKPEGSGGAQLGGQIGRPDVSRIRIPVRQELRSERQ